MGSIRANESAWEPTAGGESGWLAPHPDNPDIVYGGSYGGYLTRINHATGERRTVTIWPDNPMGYGAKDLKYRFQWNFPILFSRHDVGTRYAAGNVLFKTNNEGQSWEAISPDLTRNDTTTMGPSGGPITKDNTSVEYYGTIFAVAEGSEEGVIWIGSDDGLIHITRDGGENWTDITPPERMMPEWAQINEIMAHPFEPGGLYVAATRYKSDDFAPYLYKTTDYGQTWTKITDGIDPLHFTRSIQPDMVRPGLLYAGTESGMYVSFDDGANWQSFQLNLPVTPITDLDWRDNDLIVATQGRSFWVLDDLTPLHQLTEEVANNDAWLYTPDETVRMGGFGGSSVTLRYHFKDVPDSSAVTMRIVEQDGDIIKSFTQKDRMELAAGMNEFTWNMRYPDASRFDGLILWAGGTNGPRAAPGTYEARLIVGDDSMSVNFDIVKDPRASATQADLQAQFDYLIALRDKLTETHDAINDIRDIRAQVNAVTERLPDGYEGGDEIKEAAKAMLDRMKAVEEALYQTKNRSGQDPLNFPIRLNNRLSALAGVVAAGDNRPTDQAVAVYNELTGLIDAELATLSTILTTDLPAFNELVREKAVPAIVLEPDEAATTIIRESGN